MADNTSVLKQLARQVPGASQSLAQQQAATRDIQMQQLAQRAAPTTPITRVAQQGGAAVAQQAGQQQVQGVQQAAQVSGQIAQLGQQVQQLANQRAIADQRLGLRSQEMADSERLAQISEQAKQEMFDSRRQFSQDELGRKFTNERQLADYAKLRATSEEQWKDYIQRSEQLYQRKAQFLEATRQKIAQQLQLDNQTIDQMQDQLSKMSMSKAEAAARQRILQDKLDQRARLEQAEVELRKSLAREQADSANRQARNSAIGSIAGAVIGGTAAALIPGGQAFIPQAAAAGSALGGGIAAVTG